MSHTDAAAVRPVTYPARPINGGPLELTTPKPGRWCCEPKYNGWRTLVHAPTGAMFNRRGHPLSIAGEFGGALKRLRQTLLLVDGRVVEWFDCEALDRRHALGRGTLLVFDYVPLPSKAGEPLERRQQLLARGLPAHDYRQRPQPAALYRVQPFDPATVDPKELYRQLRQWVARWGCPLYEGLVAKRLTDPYPVQLRSPHEEFVGWVKHRWAGRA